MSRHRYINIFCYEILKGNAQIIVNKIPQTASECSNAYKNIPNKDVIISTALFSNEIIFFLKKISSTIGGSTIVDIANSINDIHEFLLNPIIPVFKSANMLSKTIVIINAPISPTAVKTTCFQNSLPLFKLYNHSFNEKSFLYQKNIAKIK